MADELAVLVAGREPGALLFTDGRGGPLRGNNFRRCVWQLAAVTAGFGEMVTGERGRKKYEDTVTDVLDALARAGAEQAAKDATVAPVTNLRRT